ncbi:MAG: hypothetical protein AAB801_00625 [Patescibacteria group bacterium]
MTPIKIKIENLKLVKADLSNVWANTNGKTFQTNKLIKLRQAEVFRKTLRTLDGTRSSAALLGQGESHWHFEIFIILENPPHIFLIFTLMGETFPKANLLPAASLKDKTKKP